MIIVTTILVLYVTNVSSFLTLAPSHQCTYSHRLISRPDCAKQISSASRYQPVVVKMKDEQDDEPNKKKFSDFMNNAGKEVAKVTDLAKKKVSDDVSWMGDRAKETVSKFNEEMTKEKTAAEEMFARFDQFMSGAKKSFEQHTKGQKNEENRTRTVKQEEVENKERVQK